MSKALLLIAKLCAGTSGFIGLLSIAGYAFGVESLYRTAEGQTAMALNTAVALSLLAFAMLISVTLQNDGGR